MDNPEDQQDLFQEIICQLWKSYDTFRNESQFSTWMYRVAVNTAIVFFKKEKRKVASQSLTSENIKADDDDIEHKETQINLFYKAVNQLGKIEKALVFYHLQGFSHKEIGLNMGVTEGNARVKLNRAKNKLKEIVKQQAHGF